MMFPAESPGFQLPWSKDDQRVPGELDLVPHKRCILLAKNIWSQDEEVRSGVIFLGTLYSVFDAWYVIFI